MAKLLSDRTAEWLRGEMRGGNDMRSRRRITRWTPQESTGVVYQPFQLAIRDTGEVDEHDEPIYAVFVRGRESVTIVGSKVVWYGGARWRDEVDVWEQVTDSIPEESTTFYLYVWISDINDEKPYSRVAAEPPTDYVNSANKLAEIPIGGYVPAGQYSPEHIYNDVLGIVYVARFYGDANENDPATQYVTVRGPDQTYAGRISLNVLGFKTFDQLISEGLGLMVTGGGTGIYLVSSLPYNQLSVVTDVDFANETVTKKTIKFLGTVTNA